MTSQELVEELCDLGNEMLKCGENPHDVLVAFSATTGTLAKIMRKSNIMDEKLMDRCIKALAVEGLSQ